jgi:mycoredoxin
MEKLLKSAASGSTKGSIVIYSAPWCSDCWRAKFFLKERGVQFEEVNVEEDAASEKIVILANRGKRRLPR